MRIFALINICVAGCKLKTFYKSIEEIRPHEKYSVVFNFMKEIVLNTVQTTSPNYRKYSAIVDDEDYEILIKYRWNFKNSRGKRYAYCSIVKENGTKGGIFMHVLLMGVKNGYEIDHKDGNGLNNCKSNLRFCTHSNNCRNRKSRGMIKYAGVFLKKEKRRIYKKRKNIFVDTYYIRYYVSIYTDGAQKYLGRYLTAEEGALAYDNAAIKYFGEFARLNQTTYPELLNPNKTMQNYPNQ